MEQLESTIRANEREELAETLDLFRKIEDFVRLGLMPIQDLPLLKRAFAHMRNPTMSLPYPERKVFYDFFDKIMNVTLNDPTINLITRQRISVGYGRAMSQPNTNIKLGESVDLKGTPEGTLVAYANAVKNKIRAGGKPTTNDKALASQAKNELRRRRNVNSKRMSEEKEDLSFEEKLGLTLEHFEITGISELTPDNKAAFFDYMESI